MSRLFLGLNSSTQSLSAVIADYDARAVVYERSVEFDAVLPGYGTQNGVLPNSDLRVVHAPPLMWAETLGGPAARAEATGSTTFERSTGPQIRKFFKTEPDSYGETAHIELVSSFLAYLLAGKIAPSDHGDGGGMNLMDIQERAWYLGALEATTPELSESCTVIGPVGGTLLKGTG